MLFKKGDVVCLVSDPNVRALYHSEYHGKLTVVEEDAFYAHRLIVQTMTPAGWMCSVPVEHMMLYTNATEPAPEPEETGVYHIYSTDSECFVEMDFKTFADAEKALEKFDLDGYEDGTELTILKEMGTYQMCAKPNWIKLP